MILTSWTIVNMLKLPPFIDILYAHSFLSLINRPTRVAKESATLIDNIYINCFSNIDDTPQYPLNPLNATEAIWYQFANTNKRY